MIYDRAARMTSTERWIALMLAIAARHGLRPHVAADLLDQVLRAPTAFDLYDATYNAALAASGALR